ncbi:cytochrome P450 [Amylocystis lapponica]|nr:cytochrome P450 [Amylocystis lapponica]
MTTPIPHPPSLPFLGHVTSIDKEVPLRSFNLLADEYGEIYEFFQFSRRMVIVNSYELMNDVCDDKKFYKNIAGTFMQVRHGLGDGLFTAKGDEENWALAHRLLMPAFSTIAVRDMFDEMVDIASQLVTKWERFGPAPVIDPSNDFTRLTFDTIALCAMSYRLNSFYREGNHPFVQAMVDFLVESGQRAFRPALVNSLMRGNNEKYTQDIKIMADLANEIIAERRANPSDKDDLLNKMLLGKDPKTGKSLPDDNIRNNLLTFLVAGHETTSSTLCFAFYYIVKKPEVMRKVREEVDEVLGDQAIQLNDLSKLHYVTACIREALRLHPAASMRSVDASEDTIIGGGKYRIPKGWTVLINTIRSMQDPLVWGEDAAEFNPDRMLDGKFEAVPANAWQPFGYGMRACIGRAVALQEMIIAVACVFQKFDLVMDDPSYELALKQTLTIKPDKFYFHAIPRKDRSIPLVVPGSALLQARRGAYKPKATPTASAAGVEAKQPLYVLYGSNTGTSETFAQRIASAAAAYGFRATISTLDSVAERLPTDGPVIVITASFEGEPADNAAHFVEWIKSLKGSELANVSYGVFGCGNRDWVRSFQRIPALIDSVLAERGARRLVARGVGDASSAEFFEAFDEWEATLWETLPKEYGTTVASESSGGNTAGIQMETVDVGTERASALRQPDAELGTVVENRLLTGPNVAAKRHIELDLPQGMAARAGDYLAILPTNPDRDVHRAIARFSLSAEQRIVLTSSGPTSLPVDKPISIFDLLTGYVELSQPATTRDLRTLASAENSEESSGVLKDLSAAYAEKVLSKRLSVLDILEDNPDIKLSFETYLHMLPSMRIRQYSISSSPLWSPTRISLTVSVVAATITGRKETLLGVASTFLANLRPGDKVQMAVRASSMAFHPPADPTVPMIMFAAGSGLSPMRGFLQERAMQKKAGREVAKSLLFFGCRAPQEDYLYSDSDLKEWSELGIVEVKPAFSRAKEDSAGCKYVQERVWHERADIIAAYETNAKFFSCGSKKVAQGIRDTLTAIIKEHGEVNDAEAAAMFDRATQGRYVTDIFE